MSSIQGRSVVGAIAGDGNHLALLLQQSDKARLVVRTRTRHDFYLGCALGGLSVVHSGKIGTADYRVITVLVGPQTHLTANLTCRATGIASDDFHFHTGIAAILDSGRHIGAHRVADGDKAQVQRIVEAYEKHDALLKAGLEEKFEQG